jgi:phosphatidylserine/phosphatidylglycerophosphate/cardiolipin synthase-like enzyme
MAEDRRSLVASLSALALSALALSALALSALLGCATDQGKPPAATIGERATLTEAYEALAAPRAPLALRNLSDNVVAWATRWSLVESATERVDVSYFIVDDDIFGLSFLGLLLDKARSGVSVRLLVDARGSLELASGTKSYLRALVATGNADVYVYNTMLSGVVRFFLERDASRLAASTHNKLLIVDGKRTIIGGRNIADEYFTDLRDHDVGWIDSDVLVEGERIAHLLTVVFDREVASAGRFGTVGERDSKRVDERRDELLMHHAAMDAWLDGRVANDVPWADLRENEQTRQDATLRLTGAAIEALPALPAPKVRARFEKLLPELVLRAGLRGATPADLSAEYEGDARVIHKSSVLDAEHNTVLQAIFDVAPSTARIVRLETPYLLLHKKGFELLAALRDLNIEVHILTNSPVSSDSPVTQALFVEHWPELMARAPNLRVFAINRAGRLLHAKRAVFDDELVMVGTYNLDPLSRAINSEVALVVRSPAYAAMVRGEFDALAQSDEVVEYKIERDADGNALRWPEGHERAGRVKVAYGPDDHCPEDVMKSVRRLRRALLLAKPLSDLDGIYW